MRSLGEDAALLINAWIGRGLEVLNLPVDTPEGLGAARLAAERWADGAHAALRRVSLDNVLAREFTYLGPLREEVGHDGSFAGEVRLFEAEVRKRVRYLMQLQQQLVARPA
jgi:hypothetical protein